MFVAKVRGITIALLIFGNYLFEVKSFCLEIRKTSLVIHV